jgi:hypothetical protein
MDIKEGIPLAHQLMDPLARKLSGLLAELPHQNSLDIFV